jgi:hypothetical protein
MPKKTIATVTPVPAAPVEAAIPETYVIDPRVAEIVAYVQAASIACTADIQHNKRSDASARTVAAAFDAMFAFDWTKYRGNGSAKTCEEKLGLTPEEFKSVKFMRDNYKTEWTLSGLTDTAFDRRWQTLKEVSAFAPVKPEGGNDSDSDSDSDSEGDTPPSTKTKAEQCIAALENALRYATHEEFGGNIKTAEKIRAALKLNGWTEAE